MLTDTSHPSRGKFLLINLPYIIHQLIRWKKHHIISFFLPAHSCNIFRDLSVFLISSSGIPTAHIPADQKASVFLFKRRFHIHPKIFFPCAQHPAVIFERQQSCGKKYRADSFIQEFLQISRRIDAKQLHIKSAIFSECRIDYIIFIHQF